VLEKALGIGYDQGIRNKKVYYEEPRGGKRESY